MAMDYELPGILLTGASGFVGRNFIKAATGKFRFFCIARRSMEDAGVQKDPNLRWTQVDIGDWDRLKDIIQRIKDRGGVDYTVHFAGYYDFSNKNHPEYLTTNVIGTRNILEVSKQVAIKRFLFASSLAACRFPPDGEAITEQSPPDADFPYAWSKREGEKLVAEYARLFPCTIIRMAAVFSDWCEYPPLYTFLNDWLSGGLKSRVIGGRGLSAVPYIHVQDLARCCLRVIEKSPDLPRLCTYNASPSGSTSHLELFKTATRFYFHKTMQPLCLPRQLLAPMIVVNQLLCRLRGRQAFAHLWMLGYLDKKLNVDASRTQRDLAWQPTPRKSIARRLLFLIENMKNNPELWRIWNEAMLRKAPQRPLLALQETMYAVLVEARDSMINEIIQHMTDAENKACLCMQQEYAPPLMPLYVKLAYQLIVTVLKTRNRPMMRQYAKTIAFRPLVRWLGLRNLSDCMFVIGNLITDNLRSRPEFKQKKQKSDEFIAMTIHLAIDQIEDYYELLSFQYEEMLSENGKIPLPIASSEIEKVIRQLEDLCREAIAGQSWMSPLANTPLPR